MKQLFLFLLGVFSGLCTLFFVALFRFVLEPDYVRSAPQSGSVDVKPKRNRWDAPEWSQESEYD